MIVQTHALRSSTERRVVRGTKKNENLAINKMNCSCFNEKMKMRMGWDNTRNYYKALERILSITSPKLSTVHYFHTLFNTV